MSRTLWLAGARIGVAAIVLGTGAVVRANVASGPADAPASESAVEPNEAPGGAVTGDESAEGAAATTVVVAVESPSAAEQLPSDDAAPTTVLVAAPVPPAQAPTAQTAAPSHVRSVQSVWLEEREDELRLRAQVADVCTAEVKVEENANLVYVYVFERPSSGATCAAAETGVLTVVLDGPLGARLVIDAVTGEQFVVGLGDPGATTAP